jgi:hypothetical protein
LYLTTETLRRRARRRHSGTLQTEQEIVPYILLASLACHYISTQYTAHAALGIDLTSDKTRRAWLTHIGEVIIAFCRDIDRDDAVASATSSEHRVDCKSRARRQAANID